MNGEAVRRPSRIPGMRGIALLAGLVLLAALSLLAMVAATDMLSQERMAANLDDSTSARANADQALAGGLAVLLGTPEDRRTPGCAAYCFLAPSDTLIRTAGEWTALPEFEPASWWQREGRLPGTDPVSAAEPDVPELPWAQAPRFTIEEVAFRGPEELTVPESAPPVEGVGYYRILGRGTGRQAGLVAVTEAIVARPWVAGTAQSEPTDWAAFCAPFQPWYDCGGMAWRARR
ncbi:pilus assembly PilX family protein [Elongatibacter sediminis]|uniref:Type 4 fimbrial biogenesis protein PilX N-terminal domain-containing protein n=1 Tax=Elongatibacter sediminis TaxID=3119006 RepID=A0AAW9RL96_9GAMM